MLAQVRGEGLLRRRPGYYIGIFSVLVILLGASFVALAHLRDSWFSLLIAVGLGVLFTQFSFLAHEAGHRQIFESGKANDCAARILADFFAGLSFSWWTNKHTRHHANPNTIGKDPDIAPGVVAFTDTDAVPMKPGFLAALAKRQGWWFYPVLLLEGVNLHFQSYRKLLSRGPVNERALSIALILTRNVVYLSAVFLLLPTMMAFVFIAVQLAVFGFYMGASFAPNHIGMPVLAADSRVDFLRRQVLTSRNVTGGEIMNVVMGGLNYQIEHHLFPSMARPHLKRARVLVKEYCESMLVPYTETNLFQAHAIVIAHIHKVGLAAGEASFQCPSATRYGR